ncbi:AMP-dependent synthetase/ligase [Flavobacterium aciduliphilum]|uniref:Long-chain acyl-CoA synthetase n=1 Tax=Flavobacterium aciduliphilum TaxID=1101402 RepID=A0A328YG51_9FLAO|nr:AMP-dependent synthetase/ligase [Flavobacterium aciduliphilum]RAR72590.1 long-chain acyl-CoA synthetase [Flavobacterium aciduliphilum]
MSTITRLFDFPYHQLEKNNLSDCLVTKYNGKWVKTSTKEYITKSNVISRALLRLGVEKNDKIAIISSTNRTEWNIMDIGVLQTGAQTVPIYPTISEDDYEYILNHCEAKYCIVSDVEVLYKVNLIREKLTFLKEVYSFNEIEGCKNWKELLKLGEDESNQLEVEDRKNNVQSDELATIIYTSGTTGKPKGVMLSHNNIVSNVLDSASRIPFKESSSKALSFLPICHIFERVILYIYQYYSVSIYFAESIDKLSDNIKEVQPTVFSVVPRLLEKVYDKIIEKGSALTGIKRKLFFWAVDLGLQYEPYGANGIWYNFKLGIARKLIFSQWQKGLGGNLTVMVSGSAALQTRLTRIFAAAQMPVMEGYGLTETSPVITVNDKRNRLFKIGTVGKPIHNVTVKIAEDGEILCKGPNVMLGYFKDKTLTKEVLVEGYFHTGDIGEIDAEGFLKITDRKKEMFKTSGGKYIAPQVIENTMKQSLFIEQIMVIGDGEKMPAAFIQPNFEYTKQWASSLGIELGATHESLITHPKVLQKFQEEIEHYNEKFGNWEKIKKFELTSNVWSIDGGELTPTLKLKRIIIKEKYKALYEKIYNE